MCDVDVFALSFGVEECDDMPTVREDLQETWRSIRRRVRRVLRRPELVTWDTDANAWRAT